jgi:hypothetical protein
MDERLQKMEEILAFNDRNGIDNGTEVAAAVATSTAVNGNTTSA